MIRTSLVYFLKLQLCILLTLILSIPVMYAARFATSNAIARDIVHGIGSIIIQCVLCFVVFRREKIDERKLARADMLRCFGLALIPHFLLSFINGFYPYTAGYGVGLIGLVIGAAIKGEAVKTLEEVPIYVYLILMAVMMGLMLVSVNFAYSSGARFIEKEKQEVLSGKDD